MYDSRIGRRWEMDPIVFEWQSPYATFDNNPVYYNDLLGASTGTGTPGGKKADPDLGGMITVNPPAGQESTAPAEKPIHLEPIIITQLPSTFQEPSLKTPNNSNNAEFRQAPSEMHKQKAWITNTRMFLRGIEQFNPVSQGWDAISHLMFGTDKYGHKTNNFDFTYSAIGAIPFANFENALGKNIIKNSVEPNRIYSARVLLRSAEEPGPFHNFPLSFDNEIFKNGSITVIPNYFKNSKPLLTNTSINYELRGAINGRNGAFQIYVRPSVSDKTQVITHRFFKPD